MKKIICAILAVCLLLSLICLISINFSIVNSIIK